MGAGMPRAQLDIISSSDATALIVDAQDTGNSFEARVAGVPKMVIDSGGNVGFGTMDPRKQFHIEGDMLLTGRIVDSNMRDLWIPGSTLQWQATLSPPLFTLPAGGSLTYTLQQGRYRYIGNEVVYNVNMAGSIVSRPTDTSADFKLNVPYEVSSANYPVATIIGELWLTVTSADGLSTNAFKAFAKTITSDANNAHVRFLSGTTEGSLSTMAAGTTFSLQGQLIYNTLLIANVNGIPPSYIPAPIVQDQVGRVGINMGNNSPTSALYVRGNTTAEPAIIVNQTASTGDVLKFQKLGVDRLVISNAGNVGIGTTNPLQALHVLANARVDGSAILGDSVTADAHTVSGSMAMTYSGTGTALTVNQQGTGKLFEVQDGGVARVTVLDGGNVGIGVTNPGQKLHVVGDTRIEGNLTVNGTQTIVNTEVGTTEQLIITNDGTGPALVVNQSGATHHVADFYDTDISTTVPALRVANGANVGIGTADPQQKLQVVGTVQATLFSGSGASLTALNADNVSSGTLAVARGGTGNASYAVGDIIYASGATALSRLADVATGNSLISGGVGIAPAWGKIGLTTHVSGTLDVANGGTGTTTSTGTGSVVLSAAPTMTGTVTMTGSVSLTGNTTRIQQSSTATWSGDAGVGFGKLEYHSNRWYVNAGSDSALIVNFRRGGADMSFIDNNGDFSKNAATATTLQTARTINGTSFNGSANITVTANTPQTHTRGAYLTGLDFNGGTATTWAVDATITATASKVVARDGSGDDFRRYGFAEYFNMSHGASGATTDTIFYSSSDNYIRKNNQAGMQASLNVPTRTGGNASGTWGINITGNAAGLNASPTLTGTVTVSGNLYAVGCIIQVIQGYSTSQPSSTSTTFVSGGISATITPKFASSRIFVFLQTSFQSASNNTVRGGHKLFRNAVELGYHNDIANINIGTPLSLVYRDAFSYMDSPATTSAVTYSNQFRREIGNGSYGEYVVCNADTGYITLMEIAS
jgi:hypothetical protein